VRTFEVGDVIAGKYEVTRVLGQGGMGLVVAAFHRDLDALVALKVLLPSLRESPQSKERFTREARTASPNCDSLAARLGRSRSGGARLTRIVAGVRSFGSGVQPSAHACGGPSLRRSTAIELAAARSKRSSGPPCGCAIASRVTS
jgi:hypothetical protein